MYIEKQTYVILVNYNNWSDTIICAQDLIQCHWNNVSIIIVDNKSTDNSVEEIYSYLRGGKIEFLKREFPKWKTTNEFINISSSQNDVHFFESNYNRGFAAGNNLGIQKAFDLAKGQFYVWLLNNDTVVHENSLAELKLLFDQDDFGLIGSKILNFDPPHAVQSLYGSFDKWTGMVKTRKNFGNRISYPIGASMFTHSSVIDKVGLFDEDYFLYFEELDYSTRVRRSGYKIGVAEKSLVYHHQGATTKSQKGKKKKNLAIEKFKYVGLKKFYSKHYSLIQLISLFNLLGRGINQFLKGDYKHAILIFKTINN